MAGAQNRPLARAVLGLSLVGFFVLGATTSQRVRPAPPPPKVRIDVEPLTAPPPRCQSAGELERLQGPVPSHAVPVLKMTLTTDRALPLAYVEEALEARARRACCDGVSLLRAVADDGARGVLEATAVGWRHPPDEGEPASNQTN